MKEPLRVLIVEDSEDDALLLVQELKRGGYQPVWERVDTTDGLTAALDARVWDAVLSDYHLPQFNGMESLKLVRARLPDVPFLLVSGAIGEETAVAVMKAGANDYLNKHNLVRFVPALVRELGEAEIRRQRHRAEAELAAWQTELESRVAERTAALSVAHQKLKDEVEERRRLEAEIARVSEREQLRLGQELHDGLGQQLTGIGYLLTALRDKLEKTSPAQAREAHKVQTLIFDSIEQTRHLAKGFYPVELERDGLLVALREITTNAVLPAGVSIDLQSDENPACAGLKGPLAIQLFRIAQEALRNAIKHARAKHIVICLGVLHSNITLLVKDDGRGFSPGLAEPNGMGLRIMHYRARTIGGTLEVRNRPDVGVVVSCTVPLPEQLLPERNF